MKSVRYLITGLVVLLLWALSVPAMAQDVEATEEPAPAITVPIMQDGDTLTDTFAENVTTHLFGFNATEGDVVTISMTQEEGSDLDPFLVVLGPAGQVIASDDDSGEMMLSALIADLEIETSGSYLILATSFEYVDNIIVERGEDPEAMLAEEQNYEISISGITPPVDLESFRPDSLTYFRSELEYGTPFPNGYSTAEEPVYYFIFDGEAGDVIDIEMMSDDFDTLLFLFNPSGSRIAINNNDLEGDTTNSAIRGFELPEDGRYLIMATDQFFYNASDEDAEFLVYTGGDFTITVSLVK